MQANRRTDRGDASMKSARERMDMHAAYKELGSYRAAAELCGGDVVSDTAVEGGEGLTQGSGLGWRVRAEERSQDPVMDLGVEDRRPESVVGGDVGVGPREAGDQAMEAQSPQVVGHLGRGVAGAEQSGDEAPKALACLCRNL